jgi:hypothetical protein
VDEKNIPEHEVMNVTLVILTANRTDGIYIPPDDRRHDVMWSRLTKYDFTEDYWISMWKWYDEGGDGHVAAYLATLDISTFNPKAPPPQTEAFWTIVDADAPEEGGLRICRQATLGGHPQSDNQGSDGTGIDILRWLEDRRNRRSIPIGSTQWDISRWHSARDTGLWVVAGVRQVVYAKRPAPGADRAVTALKDKLTGRPENNGNTPPMGDQEIMKLPARQKITDAGAVKTL